MQDVKLFDVVELIVDLPQQRLYAGMRGTVLEVHGNGKAFEVEFSDEQGQVLSFLAVSPEQFAVAWAWSGATVGSSAERIAELVARLPGAAGRRGVGLCAFLECAYSPAIPRPNRTCSGGRGSRGV